MKFWSQRISATVPVEIETYSEWVAACEVQQRFLQNPEPAIDTLRYGARCRQVRELGGDAYDFVPLSHNRLALAVADASGKGLAAALMISSAQSSLRTAAAFAGNDGAAVLGAVNREVHATSLPDRYVTIFYGVFHEASRGLHYVNAGHHPPMVIRRGRSIVRLESGGPPVGMFPNWTYEEGAVQLDPGDLVLAYTDGVTEALNPAGEEWGEEGLLRAVAEHDAQSAHALVEAIFRSMDEYSLGHQTDDATVIVLRVH